MTTRRRQAATPLAPLLALANNVLEAKVDALKRLAKRRPAPVLDQTSIRTYTDACLLLGALGVVNNVALVVFVAPGGGALLARPAVLVAAVAGQVLVARSVYAARALPYDVRLQLERNAYVLSSEAQLV